MKQRLPCGRERQRVDFYPAVRSPTLTTTSDPGFLPGRSETRFAVLEQHGHRSSRHYSAAIRRCTQARKRRSLFIHEPPDLSYFSLPGVGRSRRFARGPQRRCTATGAHALPPRRHLRSRRKGRMDGDAASGRCPAGRRILLRAQEKQFEGNSIGRPRPRVRRISMPFGKRRSRHSRRCPPTPC